MTFSAGNKSWLRAQKLENFIIFTPEIFFFCNFLVVPQGCLVKDTTVVLSFNVFHSCNAHECELGSDFGCW